MGFDFINHHLDLPTFMIQDHQFLCWCRLRIEQSRHQSIHLAHFTEPLIGDAVGNDTHPYWFV
jgi:hypothetical protein